MYDSDFIIYSSVVSFYIPCFVILLLYWRIMKVKLPTFIEILFLSPYRV